VAREMGQTTIGWLLKFAFVVTDFTYTLPFKFTGQIHEVTFELK
jgi:hypothetical protein